MTSDNKNQTPRPEPLLAEAYLLGSMILDTSVIDKIVRIVKPEHFTQAAHRTIFAALLELRGCRGSKILALLHDWLMEHHRLEEVGGVEQLVRLVDGVPAEGRAEEYARIVRNN